MQSFRRFMNSKYLLLFCICSSVLLFAACGIASIDTTFTTALAIMDGIGIVLATVGALLSPAESAAIQGAVTIAIAAVNELKSAVDAYEADKTGTGTEAAINAAVASVKASLPGVLAAAQIKNPTLQAWITNVVNLISNVVVEIETDILPHISTARASYLAGDTTPATTLDDKFKAIAAKLKADNDTLLDQSGLDPKAIAAAKKHVHDKTARHIGPVRI